MMNVQLSPKAVFDYFRQINGIPRPSKHEEQMMAFLQQFAAGHGLACKTDAAGNVLISKPATAGCGNRRGVVLQAHMDMVCEKRKDIDFDFLTQPIEASVDGEWMRANGTTLGADDGIGIALALAVLTDATLEHGPLECLFTRDEETGLSGAFALEAGFMTGKFLINLDSEDEGEIFVGCAGGANTTATFPFASEPLPQGYLPVSISIDHLTGGHSGDDINKRRANANKLLARILHTIWQRMPARLFRIAGGNLHNAIPRDAAALIAVPFAEKEAVRVLFNHTVADLQDEFHAEEPNMRMEMETDTSVLDTGTPVMAADDALRLIQALQAVHNGVLEMSQDIPGLVETSSNLASVRTCDGRVVVVGSQRSSSASSLANMVATFAAPFRLIGASVATGGQYPGWKPNLQSELLRVAVEVYRELFGKEPRVRAIHAGLECGLFSEKYPGLDMISVGPTLRGVHSPDERLLVPTVEMVWKHLAGILRRLA